MSVTHIEDYLARNPKGRPRQICFFGPIYLDMEGNEKALTVCVKVKDGDVAGVLSKIQEDGGILQEQEGEDGTFYFLPWPCAAVEIRDSDSADDENPQPSPPE